MIIANKESYKNISIKSLDLSNRTINALHCGDIHNLYQLIENFDRVEHLRNIGEKGVMELSELLRKISCEEDPVEGFSTPEIKSNGFADDLSDEIKELSVKELRINTRAVNALIRSGIKTIGQLCEFDRDKLFGIKNMGNATANSVIEEIDLLTKIGCEYFSSKKNDDAQESDKLSQQKSRAIDIDTVNLLRTDFGLKMVVLSDILGISKQSLDQRLHKRINKGNWLNKELLPDEEAMISDMISNGLVMRKETESVCCILNNQRDNCCVLLVYSDDIKCFFLVDLPDMLQTKIKENGYDRFTSVELNVINTLGKTIKVLGEVYFVPSSDQFYRLAKSRGMNADGYSLFLTGYKFCSLDKCITDDRIISFLRSNTKNGKTQIKHGSETKWIFSFAEEHGLSIEQLAEYYGFDMSIEKEPDMQVFEIASDAGYIEKIYAKYPLLGSKIISAANIETINKRSRQLLNTVMSSSDSKLTLQGKMVIVLSVINYSKNWAYEDESKFWKYIAEQFGYRDETGRLGNILRGCVKDALTDNNRCFITNEYGNKYKSTVLLHALAPKETWYRYCDFLFSFYKENIGGRYVENDEIINRMIAFLGKKFNNDKDEEDENIKIGSNVYSFGEGLVKLIRYRPIYASKVADTLLKHIDARYNHRNPKPVCYEEELCDEWYDEYYKKILLKEETKQRTDISQETRVARDYTRINPLYCLYMKNNVVISFPDIRLKKVDFSSLQLEVLNNKNVVIRKSLKYYGNELGKTLKSFSVSLSEIMNKTGADSIAPQIIIKCDEETIYDSAERLFRKFIVFNRNTETEISNCNPGSYLFVAPIKDKIEFVNAEPYDALSDDALKGTYAILKEDFTVSFNDEIVAFDNKADQNVKLLISRNSLKYITGGERYDIISNTDKIRILLNGERASLRYRLFINDKETVFDGFQSDNAGNGTIYTINTDDFSDSLTSIRIFDTLKDKLIENRKIAVLPAFKCTFDKICYFTPNDFSDSLFTIENKDGYYSESSFEYGNKIVSVPYENGEIETVIPVIAVTDTAGNVWNGSNCFYIGDISHDLFLSVDLPDGYRAEMYFGTYRVSEESGRLFGLGNSVVGYTNTKDDPSVEVTLKVTAPNNESKNCLIGRIYIKEQFVSPPKFYFDNGVLSWNKGFGFIGGNTDGITLSVIKSNEILKNYSINMETDIIDADCDLKNGIYKYVINKKSGSLFAASVSLIDEGELIVGDINGFRFEDSKIVIEALTFEKDEGVIQISRTYIDNIQYNGIMFVDTEGRECPVYTGIMYFVNPSGERHEFSYEDTVDSKYRKLYQVNPVRIVYINDSIAEITNEGGQGLYFRKYFDKYLQKDKYLLTDREYNNENRGAYSLADLYIYKKAGK